MLLHFSGHAYQHELLLYTENCFIILKSIFTSSTTTNERLATLYLMYAMYFKQPTKDFCKFRFTLADWVKMKNFYDGISAESKYLQARAIFWRLWQANAFRLVECDREHYPETMQFHRLGNDGLGDFQKINSTIISSVNDLQNESKGLLSAIETLQVGYNEMKDHFATNINECTNMQSIDVIGCVNSQLGQIKKLFESKFDGGMGRRREKPKAIRTRSSTGGPSRAIQTESETEFESEPNESTSSFGESNDETSFDGGDSDDDDGTMSECLNIGSKRYYLKRRALQKETGDLHRLRSSVVAPRNISTRNPGTDEETNFPEPVTYERIEKDPISIDDTSGTIVISHQRKVYNRHSKHYKSTVRKQFIDYPP